MGNLFCVKRAVSVLGAFAVPRSIFKRLTDPNQDEQGRLAALEDLKKQFELFLRDPQLTEVFRCLYAGVRSAEGIAVSDWPVAVKLLESESIETRRECVSSNCQSELRR